MATRIYMNRNGERRVGGLGIRLLGLILPSLLLATLVWPTPVQSQVQTVTDGGTRICLHVARVQRAKAKPRRSWLSRFRRRKPTSNTTAQADAGAKPRHGWFHRLRAKRQPTIPVESAGSGIPDGVVDEFVINGGGAS